MVRRCGVRSVPVAAIRAAMSVSEYKYGQARRDRHTSKSSDLLKYVSDHR